MSGESDRGGIITGFLFRAVFLFALLGVSVYEAGAIIVTKVTVEGVAGDAAREAAIGYARSSGSTTKARAECARLASRSDARCVSLDVEDGWVTVRVRKEAPTLLAHRIGPFTSHTVAEGTARAKIP